MLARDGVAAHATTAVVALAVFAIARAAFAPRRGEADLGAGHDVGPAQAAARAAQPGRGRTAISPWQIPWAGWKDIFQRVWREIGEDRLLAIAAGVVFFGLLALFPAITALVSSYGLFASPATIAEHLSFLASAMPAGAFSVVQDQIARVVANGDVALGFKFVFGLALALWSANAGMKAIIDALNVVYEEEEKRGFFELNLVSLAFTIGALVAALIAVAGVVGVPAAMAGLGLGEDAKVLLATLRWPTLFVALTLGLSVLYRFGPSRTQPKWRWASVGALAGAAAWIAGSAALSFYISRFGDYDATYGSLGAAIGLMMWMWLSAIVVLFGAELNAEIEHQTAIDSTRGAPKPLGGRGARMADSVGESAA
ncbi:MAG: YihY/virulence factor BrkB family protein [Methylobacteriaceae bacterium]|nr:YihY/virulence factor BrkB family protein [Methylobacteriaceae bacterium]